MPLLENIRKCVSRRHGLTRRPTRVLFNVRIEDSFKSPNVPSQIRDLLVYIARDGVAVTDLFRRPGNPQHMKKIISDLEAGRPITWSDYNFYTLANIAKRYLLHIEGGILGCEAEEKLLSMLDLPDDQARIEGMHSVIISQPKPVQQLLALLFGIWFRMIYHTEVNAMSVEAVAKSVAGSVFPSCTASPQKVERASKVMEYLITGFASADLFSRELIEYFTSETRTSISRVEKFKYEFRFPVDVPREKSIRLFMRLLLEEGKKHGFHLIHDAVSKELFENTDWETVCVPNIRDKPSPSVTPLKNPHGPALVQSPKPNTPEQRGAHLSADVTCTKTSTNTGILDSWNCARPNRPDYLTTKPLDDPVQQLSEKRTCVTTTPLQCQPPELSHSTESSRTPSSVRIEATEAHRTTPGFRFRIPNPTSRAGDHYPTKALARPAAPPQACFNSVKRRQLERLQKRSDWFLSPPAGLRSSGLIHLIPNASTSPSTVGSAANVGLNTVTTSTSSDGVQRDTSLTVSVSLSSSGDCRLYGTGSTVPSDSKNLDFSSITGWHDEEDEENRTDCHSNQILDEDEDEIDRLVFTDPHQLWINGTVIPSCDAAKSVKLTAGRTYPAATSSPYTGPLGFSHASKISNQMRGFRDEKDNFPEVETRYYVVERYYGPEPRQPLLSRFGLHRQPQD